MREFRDALEHCGLMDIGYKGRWFTWEHENFASNNIRERLDKGLLRMIGFIYFPTMFCLI